MFNFFIWLVWGGDRKCFNVKSDRLPMYATSWESFKTDSRLCLWEWFDGDFSWHCRRRGHLLLQPVWTVHSRAEDEPDHTPSGTTFCAVLQQNYEHCTNIDSCSKRFTRDVHEKCCIFVVQLHFYSTDDSRLHRLLLWLFGRFAEPLGKLLLISFIYCFQLILWVDYASMDLCFFCYTHFTGSSLSYQSQLQPRIWRSVCEEGARTDQDKREKQAREEDTWRPWCSGAGLWSWNGFHWEARDASDNHWWWGNDCSRAVSLLSVIIIVIIVRHVIAHFSSNNFALALA